MRAINKRLTLLTEAEKSALYGLPEFTSAEREEFLTFTEAEQTLLFSRAHPSYQLYCALQIGYFKAKQFFFNFSWSDISPEDTTFVLNLYFPQQQIKRKTIHHYEYYAQRKQIAELLGYRLWTKQHLPLLVNQLKESATRDVTPTFILMELLAFLKTQKIIRPGYTTVQTVISHVLTEERNRLAVIIKKTLSVEAIAMLQKLLQQENAISELAALKQDPKDFKHRMMTAEREKLETIKPLYKIAKGLLVKLNLSKQNILYYANLVNYYTIYDLRRIGKPEQTYLYLLCYIWQRYQQFNDNLIDAFCYHLKQLEDETKVHAKEQFSQHQRKEHHDKMIAGRLLQFLVDDDYSDELRFGNIRENAFRITPKEEVRNIVINFCEKPVREMDFRWESIDKLPHKFKIHLRPLVMALDFSSTLEKSPWLVALAWLKNTFAKEESLNQRPLEECPKETIPQRLRSFLLETGGDNQKTQLRTDRYEFWIYRQLRKRLNAGELYVEDSIRHRSLDHELASFTLSADIEQLNVPGLQTPMPQQLGILFTELHELWHAFNNELASGELKHLHYDTKHHTLHLRKSKTDKEQEELQHRLYGQLPLSDITEVIRFVNADCHFLSAFTPVQSRYGKQQKADENSLIGGILAQALNHGNLNMAEISNIPYSQLQETFQSRVRLSTLEASNDIISNGIARMPIFPSYSIDLKMLYGGGDGQKYEVKRPTTKARHSKKYFGKARGVVAYTLLANHVPLRTQLISPNEHESYYTFDIWYNNTSDITPEILTGDMHCINKANFGIMHWFGVNLFPRFTDIQAQTKHLYCGSGLDHEGFLISPVGIIDRELIEEESPNLRRMMALLASKEISQSTLIKKLCTYTTPNRTRKALFEYDKLIRSINTLKYLRDPQLQSNIHRSQNRIESYHHLRAAIASAYGKKQLLGKTDIAIEISNQCGRLIANAIIYYNSVIHSKLLKRFEAEGNKKGIAFLKKISPVAWQHIHFLGHYAFDNDENTIDIDAIVAKLAGMINA